MNIGGFGPKRLEKEGGGGASQSNFQNVCISVLSPKIANMVWYI